MDADYLQSRTRSFEQLATLSPGWMMGLVSEGGEPIKVTGARISDNLFRALGTVARDVELAVRGHRARSADVHGITGVIVAVTTLACYFPARRAARVDPVVAIKQD